MKIMLVMLVVILVLLFLLFILGSALKAVLKQKKKLSDTVGKQKSNINNLVQYATKISEIKDGKSDMERKIQEAKSSEEVSDIVAGIVASNNRRLQKPAGK